MFPELAALSPRLRLSRRGALFGPRRSAAAAPSFDELAGARGVRRVELFAGPLSRDRGARPLASAGYLPDPPGLRPAGINAAPAFIDDHLTEPFTEGDLAAIAGRSPSSFSRAFHRHTGMALVQDVDRLRVDLACHEPMIDEPGSTTDIRFAAGFNLGDFKRRILAPKGMPSPQVPALLAENARARAAEATAAGRPPAPGAARAQRHHHRPRRSWACCGSTTVGRPARAPGAPARPPGHHGLHRPALRPAARALRAEPLHAERPVLRPGPAPGRDDAPGGPPRAGAGSPPTIRPACSRSSWPRSWP